MFTYFKRGIAAQEKCVWGRYIRWASNNATTITTTKKKKKRKRERKTMSCITKDHAGWEDLERSQLFFPRLLGEQTRSKPSWLTKHHAGCGTRPAYVAPVFNTSCGTKFFGFLSGESEAIWPHRETFKVQAKLCSSVAYILREQANKHISGNICTFSTCSAHTRLHLWSPLRNAYIYIYIYI